MEQSGWILASIATDRHGCLTSQEPDSTPPELRQRSRRAYRTRQRPILLAIQLPITDDDSTFVEGQMN